jgi:tRNA-splicing ligase RtcB
VPIGTVFGAENLVVPDVISGDIGCGMILMQTSLRADALDRAAVAALLARVNERVCKTLRAAPAGPLPGFADAEAPVVARNAERAARQLGTLGGGNHFCELQRDGDGALWVMVHSGSRGLGQAVNGHYHALAEALCAKLGARFPQGFPYLPADSDEGRGYLAEHGFCLRYAEANRELLRREVEQALREALGQDFAVPFTVQTHHNFLSKESWDGRDVYVHRKGAVAAPKGAFVTIPGSMETRSFLCRGTGCALSFGSVSHGAGRKLSRGKMLPKVHVTDADGAVVRDKGGYARVDHEATARARAEAARQMLHEFAAKGITLVTHSPEGVLDERGHGYKDVDAVIRAQHELLEVVTELTPLGVVKAPS